MGGEERSIPDFVGQPEGNRPLGRPDCKWDDNIETYLRQVGWEDVDWIDLAPDMDRWLAVVDTVMKLCVP